VTSEGGIAPLPWESEFFGMRFGMLHCDSPDPYPLQEDLAGFDLVQAKVQAGRLDMVDDLDRLGFRLAETEVSFVYEVRPDNAEVEYVVAGPEDSAAVQEMARLAFRISRFRPPWFHREDAGRLYATWAAKAIEGTFDDECLLVGRGEGMLGFVTVRDTGDRTGRIGLLASNPGGPQRNVGTRLVKAALARCAALGIERLQVATQLSHAGAMRLYQRTGGLTDSAAYWMYWSADAC
jgi:dTDP-4-amino-4,6-dideoxy-D-galactose acyltransferase